MIIHWPCRQLEHFLKFRQLCKVTTIYHSLLETIYQHPQWIHNSYSISSTYILTSHAVDWIYPLDIPRQSSCCTNSQVKLSNKLFSAEKKQCSFILDTYYSSGLKISASRLSVKMSGVCQNGSDILKIVSDGNMFILPPKSINLKWIRRINIKAQYSALSRAINRPVS